MLEDNISSVRKRIEAATSRINRPADKIKLVCVTKMASLQQVEEAIFCGITDIGENRVQDAVIKYRKIGTKVTWHMVGHLQTNKVKEAVKIFDLLHSVDSTKLAHMIDKEAKNINKTQDVLMQVNTSHEPSKFGIAPDHVQKLIEEIAPLKNVKLKGLMTIAPIVQAAGLARPYFKSLKALFDKINSLKIPNVDMQYLSMGMTQDFEVAIEEGANIVRIGTAIFGS